MLFKINMCLEICCEITNKNRKSYKIIGENGENSFVFSIFALERGEVPAGSSSFVIK